jgi:hypothetical protein
VERQGAEELVAAFLAQTRSDSKELDEKGRPGSGLGTEVTELRHQLAALSTAVNALGPLCQIRSALADTRVDPYTPTRC